MVFNKTTTTPPPEPTKIINKTMKITPIVEDIRDSLDEIGYELYYGNEYNYNSSKRDIQEKEVLLKPFDMRLERGCEYITEFNLIVAVRRKIDEKFLSVLGKDTDFIDYMLEQCNLVYDQLDNLEWLLLITDKDKLNIEYFEADSNTSLMSQTRCKINIPVKIWMK